jgi:hypothetical protein
LALLIATSSLAAACGDAVLAGNGTHARATAHPATTESDAVVASNRQPATHLAKAEPGSLTASEHRVAVVSASFASPSQGWLLAVPPCARNARPCRTLLLRKTTDGGRTWADVPAPDAPFASPGSGGDAVGSILFTSPRDGWAFGPGLWQTRDGGATWRRVSIPGGPVQDMAAGDGRVLAATGRCTGSGQDCRYRVYTSPMGSTSWRPVPAAIAWGVKVPSLVVVGRTGYTVSNVPFPGKPVLLTGPLNGSARWRPLPNPCRRAWSMAVAAAAGGWLFIGCGSEPGAGQQLKTAYLSRDYGRTWRRVAHPPSGGYISSASMTCGGTIFLSGGRMDVYVSRNRGRSWQISPSLTYAAGLAGAGFDLLAAATGNTTGYATQSGVYRRQLWLTGDGGRRWTPVTIK